MPGGNLCNTSHVYMYMYVCRKLRICSCENLSLRNGLGGIYEKCMYACENLCIYSTCRLIITIKWIQTTRSFDLEPTCNRATFVSRNKKCLPFFSLLETCRMTWNHLVLGNASTLYVTMTNKPHRKNHFTEATDPVRVDNVLLSSQVGQSPSKLATSNCSLK